MHALKSGDDLPTPSSNNSVVETIKHEDKPQSKADKPFLKTEYNEVRDERFDNEGAIRECEDVALANTAVVVIEPPLTVEKKVVDNAMVKTAAEGAESETADKEAEDTGLVNSALDDIVIESTAMEGAKDCDITSIAADMNESEPVVQSKSEDVFTASASTNITGTGLSVKEDIEMSCQAVTQSKATMDLTESLPKLNTERENVEPTIPEHENPKTDMNKDTLSTMKEPCCNGNLNSSDTMAQGRDQYAVADINEPLLNRRTQVIDLIKRDDSPASINNIGNPIPKNPRHAHGERVGVVSTENNNSCHRLEDLELRRRKSIQAHHNLFRIFIGLPPKLDCKNINNSMKEIEQIVLIANIYHCLPAVRQYLIIHLLQYFHSRELGDAILENSPRWLLLSLALECVPIFKEAMIHIVGQYSYHPWTKHAFSSIPSNLLPLIQKKALELKNLRTSIDAELFLSSIKINEQSLTFSGTFEKSGFRAWLVVQVWHDWFRNRIAVEQDLGTTYRLLAQGDHAYLNSRSVCNILNQDKGQGASDWDLEDLEDLAEDLHIMKEFARQKVQALVVNNSILDVEESGIQHLTCTKIEHTDLPWLRKDGD